MDEVTTDRGGGLPHLRTALPGGRTGARMALPGPVRAKLEQLESAADSLLAATRACSDRVSEALAELRGAETNLYQLEDAGRFGRHVDGLPEAAQLVEYLRSEVKRLAAERDAIGARWSTSAKIVEAARAYLGV
jgi:hypothetical protein